MYTRRRGGEAGRSAEERLREGGSPEGWDETRRGEVKWNEGGFEPEPTSADARPTAVSTVDLCGRHRDISLKSESSAIRSSLPPSPSSPVPLWSTKIATGMQKTSHHARQATHALTEFSVIPRETPRRDLHSGRESNVRRMRNETNERLDA